MLSGNETLRKTAVIYGGEVNGDGYAHVSRYPCYLERSQYSREKYP